MMPSLRIGIMWNNEVYSEPITLVSNWFRINLAKKMKLRFSNLSIRKSCWITSFLGLEAHKNCIDTYC